MDTNGRRNCIRSITLDFVTQSVYWVDNCFNKLESVRIVGESTSNVLVVQLQPLLSRGISIFESYLYWTAVGRSNFISRLDRSTGSTVTQVSNTILKQINGIEVIHPSRQPDSK